MMPQQKKNSVAVWRPEGLLNAEIHLGNFEASGLPRHMHATYQLGLILKGTAKFYYRGAYHTVGAGSLITIELGEPHGGDSLEPWAFSFIFVEPELVARWLGGDGLTRFKHFSPSQPLTQRLEHIYRQFISASGWEREEHLFTFLRELFGEHSEGTGGGVHQGSNAQEPKAVALVKDHLHAYFYEGVTLESLATLTALHPNYLHQVFKASTGLTPYAYLTSLRLDHAAQSLRAGLPPAVAAAAAGYTDQSHLTKHFRRYIGVTPARYRDR